VRDADVFVENFRPGVMDRKGLGYEDLRAINARLVYCSITAFGQRGPLAQKPGMDLILQATGGIMAHTGEEGGPPIKSAPPVADLNTGVYAAYAVLGALFARERTGSGQHVHVAMLDAVLSLFADNAVNVLMEGTRFGRFGSGHPDLVPYQAFPASDGYFIVACLTNAFFKRLCVALGREEWLNDPRLATNPARVERRAEVVGILSEIFKQNTCEHWIALLEQHDIPSCKVMPLHEILYHPQIVENDLVHAHSDPVRGEIVTLGRPCRCRRRRPPTAASRRCSVSTPPRSCANSGSAMTRSPPCARRTSSTEPPATWHLPAVGAALSLIQMWRPPSAARPAALRAATGTEAGAT
jgi:crotonobetainyl-CoA:carnitine CoA-transferase CaiB-like acyl-CoA transferase